MCHRYLGPRCSLLLLPNFLSSFPLIVPPGHREPTPCLAAHPTNHPRDLRSRETIASCAKIDAIWASTRCIVHTQEIAEKLLRFHSSFSNVFPCLHANSPSFYVFFCFFRLLREIWESSKWGWGVSSIL